MSMLTIENQAGLPVQAGTNRILPFTQVVRLQIPGLKGGLVWNRPVAVLVQAADGSEETLAVPDVTRQAQLTFLGAALGAAIIFGVFRLITRKSS